MYLHVFQFGRNFSFSVNRNCMSNLPYPAIFGIMKFAEFIFKYTNLQNSHSTQRTITTGDCNANCFLSSSSLDLLWVRLAFLGASALQTLTS